MLKDLYVPAGEGATLNPGDYGRVVVGENAHIILRGRITIKTMAVCCTHGKVLITHEDAHYTEEVSRDIFGAVVINRIEESQPC